MPNLNPLLTPFRPEPRQRPNRENFDDSGEFLEAENIYHFGESEEEQQLVVVDSDEVRRAPHKASVRTKLEVIKDHAYSYTEEFQFLNPSLTQITKYNKIPDREHMTFTGVE